MLTLTNIEVMFWGLILVLKGISLQVRRGSITTLIGANGAGKSTTLKAISGLIKLERGEVTRGSIEFEGKQIQNRYPEDIARHGIIYVREGRRIFDELTPEENLLIGSYLRPRGEVEEGLERVYHYFPRLKERRTIRAGYLSGGEQQMLAIGSALMAKPKLLLLDEPSLGLAPLIVAEIFEIIKRLNQGEGVTILLVEQNAKMALTVADYGYVMENGKIVLDGPAERLKEDEDVKEFYLGFNKAGRKSFQDVKSYRRRKRWLG